MSRRSGVTERTATNVTRTDDTTEVNEPVEEPNIPT